MGFEAGGFRLSFRLDRLRNGRLGSSIESVVIKNVILTFIAVVAEFFNTLSSVSEVRNWL